jgi:hypothetical protein
MLIYMYVCILGDRFITGDAEQATIFLSGGSVEFGGDGVWVADRVFTIPCGEWGVDIEVDQIEGGEFWVVGWDAKGGTGFH